MRFFSADVRLDSGTLSKVDEFQYRGNIVSADCTVNNDAAMQTRRQRFLFAS